MKLIRWCQLKNRQPYRHADPRRQQQHTAIAARVTSNRATVTVYVTVWPWPLTFWLLGQCNVNVSPSDYCLCFGEQVYYEVVDRPSWHLMMLRIARWPARNVTWAPVGSHASYGRTKLVRPYDARVSVPASCPVTTLRCHMLRSAACFKCKSKFTVLCK